VTFNQQHYFSFSVPLGSNSNFAADWNFCLAHRQGTSNYFCDAVVVAQDSNDFILKQIYVPEIMLRRCTNVQAF